MSRVSKFWGIQCTSILVHLPVVIFMQCIHTSNVTLKFIEHLLFSCLKINWKFKINMENDANKFYGIIFLNSRQLWLSSEGLLNNDKNPTFCSMSPQIHMGFRVPCDSHGISFLSDPHLSRKRLMFALYEDFNIINL